MIGNSLMREVEVKKKIVFETDLSVPEGCTDLSLGIWCCFNLQKKGELIFEEGDAQFIDKDDVLKFEVHLSTL